MSVCKYSTGLQLRLLFSTYTELLVNTLQRCSRLFFFFFFSPSPALVRTVKWHIGMARDVQVQLFERGRAVLK